MELAFRFLWLHIKYSIKNINQIKKLEVESVRAGQDYAELEKAREVTQIKCDEVQRENGSLRQLLQASHSEGRSVAEHNHALEGRLFKATEASQRSVKEAEKYVPSLHTPSPPLPGIIAFFL